MLKWNTVGNIVLNVQNRIGVTKGVNGKNVLLVASRCPLKDLQLSIIAPCSHVATDPATLAIYIKLSAGCCTN